MIALVTEPGRTSLPNIYGGDANEQNTQQQDQPVMSHHLSYPAKNQYTVLPGTGRGDGDSDKPPPLPQTPPPPSVFKSPEVSEPTQSACTCSWFCQPAWVYKSRQTHVLIYWFDICWLTHKQVDNHSFVILCILYTMLVCCSERGRATVRVLAAGGHTRKQQRHTDINAKRHHAPSRRHASVISFNGAQ